MPNERSSALARTVLAITAVLVIVAAVALLPVVAWMITHSDRPVDRAAAGVIDPSVSDLGEADYRVFAHNADGAAVRWDACDTIAVVADPTAGPPGWLDVLDEAVRIVRDASGIEIVIEGVVDERPRATRPPYDERYPGRWSPVLVAWAGEHDDVPMRAHDHALAIPLAVGDDDARVFVSGQIVLNAQRLGEPDVPLDPDRTDRRGSLLATLLHEFGHLLGLDHVHDPAQIMHPYPADGDVALGDSDRAGLAAVGADAGCSPAPPPGPVPFDAGLLTSR